MGRHKQIEVERIEVIKTELHGYEILSGSNIYELVVTTNRLIAQGYQPIGGISVHDIRNPQTNIYEPHFFQAMLKT